ncbi:hypothetical protein Golax_002129, partial [Gossypium laxum]|nr:hypothetical protein [Gossypium laxum]
MRSHSCYMLAYECFKATDDRKLDTESCVKIVLRNKNLGLDQYRFLLQTMVNSGLGEETYGPRNVLAGREETPTLMEAHEEMDEIMFGTLDNLFSKTGVSPPDIDILVVDVSLFSPSPSLTARIVNRYKMRDNIKSFSLSGMGCSASMVAIDLVQNLFKSYKNAFAVVVSSETIGPHWYCGKENSMMLSNCLFRSGGCSVLLTNKPCLKHKALMKLKHSVRTNIGSNDEAYGCCIQIEDQQGYNGFLLTRNLTKAAAKAFTMNLKVLVPKILPIRELIRFTVISIWYMEAKKRLKKGDKILMISLGAGFMCNNCVWEVMKDLGNGNVWEHCMDRYPIPRKNMINPFADKYSWINDERLNF